MLYGIRAEQSLSASFVHNVNSTSFLLSAVSADGMSRHSLRSRTVPNFNDVNNNVSGILSAVIRDARSKEGIKSVLDTLENAPKDVEDCHLSYYDTLGPVPVLSSCHRSNLQLLVLLFFLLNAFKNELFVFNDPEYTLIFFKLVTFSPDLLRPACVTPAQWHLQKHAFESFWNMLSVLMLLIQPLASSINFKTSYWKDCISKSVSLF